jgi:hypothetical protein
MMQRRYDAMRQAVSLARTGRYGDWSSVAARLRADRYRQDDVDWTLVQQRWLDRLCIEARCARLAAETRPAP